MAIATTLNDIPAITTNHGFRTSTFGTILGRSIMLTDLRTVLERCPADATHTDYRAAVEDENLLGKPTVSARQFGFRNLTEFYALDPDILIFRALRDVWDADRQAQPMLALLCASARDPILRAITPWLLALPLGATVQPGMISAEAERCFPDKFKENTRRAIGRNAASSWEQAGLLRGRRDKERVSGQARPTSVTYALLLGDLCGNRGRTLFETIWARILDTPRESLREHAATASKHGWLEYRSAGDVTEISFHHILDDGRDGRHE